MSRTLAGVSGVFACFFSFDFHVTERGERGKYRGSIEPSGYYAIIAKQVDPGRKRNLNERDNDRKTKEVSDPRERTT